MDQNNGAKQDGTSSQNGITFDQVRGPIERVVLVALTYAVAKGWITPADVASYSTLLIGIIAAVYGWWQNRPKAILQSANSLPEVTKIISTNAESVSDPALQKVDSK